MRAFRDHDADADSAASAGGAPGRSSRTQHIQRRAIGEAGPGAGDAVAAAASSSGAALPAGPQSRLEAAAGTDLSDVRVHTGPASERAAAQLGAHAYTSGNDIHFAAGRYQPDDPFGMHLLAHEVAHTV